MDGKGSQVFTSEAQEDRGCPGWGRRHGAHEGTLARVATSEVGLGGLSSESVDWWVYMASKPANTDGRHRQLGCRPASRSKRVSQQQVHCGENEAFFTGGPLAGGLRGSRTQWLDGWRGLPALGHLVVSHMSSQERLHPFCPCI